MEYGVELKKVQDTVLEILSDIIRVCTENDIEYFIIGGTALGAVRHKGFIPWDDDIDIGMTRINYNKFLSIAQNKLNKDLFLQTFETDPKIPFYFAKVKKNGTKFIEYYCRDIEMHQGLFVDIFPYDNVPDDPRLKKRHIFKVNILANLFISKSLMGTSAPQFGISGLIKRYGRVILHYILKPISKNFLYSLLDTEVQKYNSIQSNIMSYINYPYLSINTNTLQTLETISFQGMSVFCPCDLHEYLTNQYGDYMKLPSKEKRVGHRPYIVEV
jgi:lipopolysaccharide cholinephosphotransferase